MKILAFILAFCLLLSNTNSTRLKATVITNFTAYIFYGCSKEGGVCQTPPGYTVTIRYGAYSNYTYKYNVSGGSYQCDNSAFGIDPAPGIIKTCQFAFQESNVVLRYCSAEGGTCQTPTGQNATIRYGY